MNKLTGYLRLMRVPNIITAISDVLAGMAIGGSLVASTFGSNADTHASFGELLITNLTFEPFGPILLLVLATIGLYGGGVVLNDVFDAELDKEERPERPIPSGLINKSSAALFGTVLLVTGVIAAAFSSGNLISYSAIIALLIAIAAVVYDKWMKHNNILGPLNMGLCRGLNLLLGMSIIDFSLHQFWYVAIIPVMYIAAITMISRGEVHGGKKGTLYFAGLLYLLVMLSIAAISYVNSSMQSTLLFLLLHALMIFLPLQEAIRKPEGRLIGKAVKNGVIGLIAMNAALAAAFGDIFFAALIILLLPVSVLLARLFAVT